MVYMSTSDNNRQLEPKENPECITLEKDSKTCAEQQTQQNNCDCSCEDVK